MIWKRKFSFTELWVEQPGGTFKNLDHAPSLLENGGEKSDGKVSCRPLYSYPLYGLYSFVCVLIFDLIRNRVIKIYDMNSALYYKKRQSY